MIYIYNAGPLFSEADQKQRLSEGNLLREIGVGMDHYFVANPIDLPLDQSKPLTSQTIFEMDNRHIQKATVFFFELATGDTGTMVELGMAIQRLIGGEKIAIYPIFSDLRLVRNHASGIECPVGFNSFVTGSLTYHQIPTYPDFESALQAFKRSLAASVNYG
ncbi:MAG: nucleoside 2-deoxyribosyltransferase [Erysipelotrichaceae bacterium]|nr:nucleoside 2-deoxyribosyltransferase [Erysipelotrichaceae bacterium]